MLGRVSVTSVGNTNVVRVTDCVLAESGQEGAQKRCKGKGKKASRSTYNPSTDLDYDDATDYCPMSVVRRPSAGVSPAEAPAVCYYLTSTSDRKAFAGEEVDDEDGWEFPEENTGTVTYKDALQSKVTAAELTRKSLIQTKQAAAADDADFLDEDCLTDDSFLIGPCTSTSPSPPPPDFDAYSLRKEMGAAARHRLTTYSTYAAKHATTVPKKAEGASKLCGMSA